MQCFHFSHNLGSYVWKVTRVAVVFFPNYILQSCSLVSLFSLVFFSVRLSSSHNLGIKFIRVAHGFFMSHFISFFFILSFKIRFFLKLNFVFFLFCFILDYPVCMILLAYLTSSLGFATALFFKTFFSLIFFLILSFYIFIHGDWWSLFFLSSFFMMLSHGFFSFFKIQWQRLSIIFLRCQKISSSRNEARAIYLSNFFLFIYINDY